MATLSKNKPQSVTLLRGDDNDNDDNDDNDDDNDDDDDMFFR